MFFCLALLAATFVRSAETADPQHPLAGYEGLFDSLVMFGRETNACVVMVDLTDPTELPKLLARPGGLSRLRSVAARMTALSGLDGYSFHYTQLKRASLDRAGVKAIVLRPPSPAKLLTCVAARDEFWALLRETQTPVIGFCGGFHQIYLAFGGTCADMRRLTAGEKDTNPAYCPGFLKEWGFTKVRVQERDPLFAGLGPELTVLEQHVSECKQLPAEFEVLASTEACRVQVIKHKTRLIYGTQFHPEAYDDAHPDGKRILQNFFRIAGLAGTNATPRSSAHP